MKAHVYKGIREDTGKPVEGYYVKLAQSSGENLHIIISYDGEYNRIVPESLEVEPDLTSLLRRIRSYYKTTVSWDELFEDEVMEALSNADTA